MAASRTSSRFRFSVRSMLAATAFVAATLGVTSPHSSVFANLFATAVFAGAPLAFSLGGIFARGYLRAFCLGAVLPSVVGLLMAYQKLTSVPFLQLGSPERPPMCFDAMAVAWLAGLTTVAMRWLFVLTWGDRGNAGRIKRSGPTHE